MLEFASVCECGENEVNYDAIGISEDSHCTLFAVADGKGVPNASRLVLSTMMEDIKEKAEVTTSTLPNCFKHAQAVLEDFQKESMLPGGLSAAVLLTDGEVALWAHIGDARIYHLQDDWLYDITPDHSEAYTLYEAGEIRYPKIRTHRNRGNVFQLMGLEQNFVPAFSKPTTVKKNDSFLICTDGFWGNIHERGIEKALKRAKNPQEWLDRMVKTVKKNRETGKYTRVLDDYSAITIQI